MCKHSISAFHDIAVEGDRAWYYDIYHNALLKIDIPSNRISLESIPPTDGRYKAPQRYGFIKYYMGKLILAPRAENKILIYDTNLKEYQSVELESDGWSDEEVYNLFSGIVIYKKYAYFFPGRYKSIIRLDLENLHVSYISAWYKEVAGDAAEINKVIFPEPCQVENHVYLPFWQGNTVMKLNLETEKHELFQIADKKFQFSDIQYDGTDFWISVKNNSVILKWNERENRCLAYEEMPETLQIQGGFRYVVTGGSFVYAIPVIGNMIVKLDKETGKASKLCSLPAEPAPDVEDLIMHRLSILCKKNISSDLIIMYSVYDAMILFMNLQTEEIRQIKAVLENKDEIDEIMERELLNRLQMGVIKETREMSVERYITVINGLNGLKRTNEAPGIGSKIWEELCR